MGSMVHGNLGAWSRGFPPAGQRRRTTHSESILSGSLIPPYSNLALPKMGKASEGSPSGSLAAVPISRACRLDRRGFCTIKPHRDAFS